jgi:hypothetical protein
MIDSIMAARKTASPGPRPGTKHVEREPLFPPYAGVTSRHVMLAGKLSRDGKTDAEIADVFGVAERTINDWKEKSDAFRAAIREGKLLIVAEAEATLYQMAMGGRETTTVVEITGAKPKTITTTEKLHPDVRALTHILAVYDPDRWALNKIREGGENFEQGNGVEGMRRLIGK